MNIHTNYSLERLNTFHIPVKAGLFIEYGSEEELVAIFKSDLYRNLPVLPIGAGSNLLFLNDFDGIVLHSAIKGISLVEEGGDTVLIRVGAAEIWDDVVAYAVRKGWGGIENLSLIPGETGAAAIQNIGAYGVEIKDVIENVEAIHLINLEKRIFTNEACQYGYRTSIFKASCHCGPDPQSHNNYIITHVTLRLQKRPVYHLDYGNLQETLNADKPVTLQKVRDTIIRIRRQKLPDPNVLGNAGSFFMNPVVSPEKLEQLLLDYPAMPFFPAKNDQIKLSAGWLIEQCGLKGKRLGAAGIYEHQALVIVNHGGATCKEIAQLADHVRETVNQHFGVLLTSEVQYILGN